MPKVSEAHLRARKNQIIEAAVTCFSKQGFYQTTMQAICKEASLSPGAVYRYFNSKEEIIIQIALAKVERDMKLIHVLNETKGCREKLYKIADVFFSLLDIPEAYPARMDVDLWSEALRNPNIMKIVRKSISSHRDAFANIITEAQEDGKFSKNVSAEYVAHMMISMFDGLILQRGVFPDMDIWQYVDVLKKMMDDFFITEKGTGAVAGEPMVYVKPHENEEIAGHLKEAQEIMAHAVKEPAPENNLDAVKIIDS